MNARSATYALIVLLAGPAMAGAQGLVVTPNNPRPSPGWTITPVFVFSQASDSNVTLAGEATPTTSDAVASLSPSIELGFMGARTSFAAGYAGSAVRYFTVDQLDSFDQRLYGNLKHQVNRRLRLSFDSSAGWMPTTDTVMLAGVPFVRVGSRVEALTASASISLTKFTTVTAGYRFDWVSFDRSNPLASQLLGGHSNGAYGDVRRQVNARLSIGGTWDIRRADIAGGAQQFNIQNVEGTAEYRFSPALSLSGGAGLARVVEVTPGGISKSGPSWHGGINYKVERATAFATYMRSYVPTFAIGGTVQNEQFSAGVTRPIAFRERLVGTAGFAWRRNDPLTADRLTLRSMWFDASASYAVAAWLRLEGFYSHTNQDSHISGVTRNRFGVSVVALAPMRFK